MPGRPAAREALIDAAEELIAERGAAGMSVREVQIRAGQANKGAVAYHFGTRADLVGAVIESRMGPVNRRRWQLLRDLESAIGEPSTRQLVHAFVAPLVAETLRRPGSRYARFLLQAMVDPVLGQQLHEHLDADSFRAVHERLLERSGLPEPLARMRLLHVVNLTAVTLAAWEGRTADDDHCDEVAGDLVATCTAILEAAPDRPDAQLTPPGPHPKER